MGDSPSHHSKIQTNSPTAMPVPSSSAQTRLPPPLTAKKPEPMSLAAFMGGRATGPMLRKHAPQQDAYDATQFEQRTHISKPHPIFGKGGIAMPGITPKASSTKSPVFGNATESPCLPADDTPEKGSSYVKPRFTKPEPLEVPKLVQNGHGGRNRSPGRISPVKSPTSPQPLDNYGMSADVPHRQVSQNSLAQPITKSHSSTGIIRTPPSSPSSTRPLTPRHQHSSPVLTTLSKQSPITTPSLARPIAPNPKLSQGPQIPAHKTSTAFLQPQVEKAPTPSLSRLQGRGFVQNMVKVSSQLEASSSGSPTSSDKSPPMSSRKTTSVLDRWQPEASASAGATSPPVTPQPSRASRTPIPVESPSPLRTRKSADASSASKNGVPLSSMPLADTRRELTKPHKESAARDVFQRDTPGLGSSSTLISYIKPTKTGDDPLAAPSTPDATASPHRTEIDDLGVRNRPSAHPAVAAVSALPPSTGRHLRHVRSFW
jgi:hypothetical protein